MGRILWASEASGGATRENSSFFHESAVCQAPQLKHYPIALSG